MATGSLYGSVSESTGLYGIGAASGGTYFEWFIFQDSATAPATPTGGSWSFSTNTGTAPTGWLNAPPAAPVNQVWVSITIVDSRNAATFTWSVPGLMTGSGLPILSASGVPASGTGLNGQLYINTATTPQSLYFKQSGAWTQLTGSTLYATAGANSNITSLTGLTGGISTPDFVQFDTGITPTTAVAKLQWDPTHGGLQVGMAGGSVNLQVGQEEVVYVFNNTGSQINEGQIVKITGSQGQRVTVALAQANNDGNSATILGMATENIADNASGFITTQGIVNNVNTNGFADGTVVYLSPTTPGGFTATKPVAPNHMVLVGYIVKGNSGGAGSVFIHPQNGYELSELHDVLITSVANNNLLRYNSAVPAWVNIAGPSGTIVGTSDTQTLTNKTISGASNTLTNIPNSALVNDSVNVNGVDLTLGAVQLLGPDWILPSYTGNAGKVLAVNPSSSDVQWVSGGGVGSVTSIDVSGGTTGLTTSGGPITAAGVITLEGTLSVSNGGTGVTTSTGTGNVVLSDSPTLVTPALGTPSALVGTNITGTAANFNINGTVGATTPATGAFTDLSFSGTGTVSGGTANGVAYLNGSKVLTTGSALTFDGTRLGVGVSPSQSIDANGTILARSNLIAYGALVLQRSSSSLELPVATYSNGSGSILSGGTKGDIVAFGNAGGDGVIFANGNTEQMRLTSTGLGIGTSSPAYKLDVNGTAYATAGVFNTGANNVTINAGGIYNGSVTNSLLYVVSDGGSASGMVAYGSTHATKPSILELRSGSSISATLDSSGNLGLGVTPSAWVTLKSLEIAGLGNAISGFPSDAGIYVTSNAYYGSAGWRYGQSGKLATRYSGESGIHSWSVAPSGTAGNAISFTQAMTLDASGNLGIGTTSPGAKLDVNGSGRFRGFDSGYYNENVLAIGNASYDPKIGLASNSGYRWNTRIADVGASGAGNYVIRYEEGSLDTVTITRNGNLGLGVTPSAWATFGSIIQGQGYALAGFSSGSNVQSALFCNAFFNGSNYIYSSSAEASEYLQISGQHQWFTAPSGTAANAISFTQAMTLTAAGDLLVGTTSAGAGVGFNTKIAVDADSGEASIFKTSGGVSAFCSRMWNSSSSGDNKFLQFITESSPAERGSITYNRAGGLTAYNTTSDYRAKDITGPVTDSGALIDSVPVYIGKMKGATQERPMFIAHETPAYAHTGEKDAVDADGNPVYQQMDASALVPVMWAEIQSLRQRLAAAGI